MDELFEYIVKTFESGYFCYSFVINFKPGSTYDTRHPAKAHREFEDKIKSYLRGHKTFKFLCIPELSNQGKYHVHGLLFDRGNEFSEHERRLTLFRNYLRRKFGWTGFQRIHSLITPYDTTDIRFIKRTLETSFIRVWEYLIKDLKKYPFLYPFGDLL